MRTDDYMKSLPEDEIEEIKMAIEDMNHSSPKTENGSFEAWAIKHTAEKTAVNSRRNTKRLNDNRAKREEAKAKKRAAKKQHKEEKAVKSEIKILKAENMRIDDMLSDVATPETESLEGLKSHNLTMIKKLSYSISKHNNK